MKRKRNEWKEMKRKKKERKRKRKRRNDKEDKQIKEKWYEMYGINISIHIFVLYFIFSY